MPTRKWNKLRKTIIMKKLFLLLTTIVFKTTGGGGNFSRPKSSTPIPIPIPRSTSKKGVTFPKDQDMVMIKNISPRKVKLDDDEYDEYDKKMPSDLTVEQMDQLKMMKK